MLHFLDWQHDYASKALRAAAERSTISIDTGTPPEHSPLSAEEREAARRACLVMSRASGLSVGDLSNSRSVIHPDRPAQIDEEVLARSFDKADRLRMTLTGLSENDIEVARTSVRHDPQAKLLRDRLASGLSELLRRCEVTDGDLIAAADR